MSDRNPLVSAIIPVWNAEKTIEYALSSILRQSYRNFECILIDDGSTDATASIIKKIQKQDDRIRFLALPHSGIVAALNSGIRQAKGNLIARMDADDFSHAQRIEKQVQHLLERPDIGFCGTKVQFMGDKKKSAGYARYVSWTNTLISTDDIALNQFVESPFAHPSIMFRRSLIDAFGGYREGDFPEDYELWLRWMERGVLASKVDEILLDWSDLPDRLSRTDSRYVQEAFYRVKARYLAGWLRTHNPFHPEVIIWGGGRITRKRAAHLKKYGIQFTAFVDIHPGRIGKTIDNLPVISPDELPKPGQAFVISYVGNSGARDLIAGHLGKMGYIAGKHYICAA